MRVEPVSQEQLPSKDLTTKIAEDAEGTIIKAPLAAGRAARGLGGAENGTEAAMWLYRLLRFHPSPRGRHSLCVLRALGGESVIAAPNR